MSLHPSLTAAKGSKHRSVHKRFERIEKLKKDSKWKDGESAFGLPKGKIIKIKLKKAKAAEAKAPEEGQKPVAEKEAASKGASKAASKPASK